MSTDPTVQEIIGGDTTKISDALIYSASDNPFIQGVHIRDPHFLTNYTLLKARGNHNFLFTIDGVTQDQNYFIDNLAPQGLGGQFGTGSMANLETEGQIGNTISHVIERRDLGQTNVYNDSSPFEDSVNIETHPSIVLDTHPLQLTVPIGLVQATANDVGFDGVIEPFEIRRQVDRTSIDMPFALRGFRVNMSNDNQIRENILTKDLTDKRDQPTRPFLDSVEGFGDIDIQGAFSDKEGFLGPFLDSDDKHLFYEEVSSPEIKSILTEGVTVYNGSTTSTETAANPVRIRNEVVVARHGFVFSQNDNYGYDSIAFGGLKK